MLLRSCSLAACAQPQPKGIFPQVTCRGPGASSRLRGGDSRRAERSQTSPWGCAGGQRDAVGLFTAPGGSRRALSADVILQHPSCGCGSCLLLCRCLRSGRVPSELLHPWVPRERPRPRAPAAAVPHSCSVGARRCAQAQGLCKCLEPSPRIPPLLPRHMGRLLPASGSSYGVASLWGPCLAPIWPCPHCAKGAASPGAAFASTSAFGAATSPSTQT